MSLPGALDSLKKIRAYFSCTTGVPENIFQQLNSVGSYIFNGAAENMTQSKITDFLKSKIL
jgi:hypothetical protein